MRRVVLGSVVAAMVLVAVGFVLASRAGLTSRTAGQLVVRGRVIGTDGTPVSGIKVWLNVWPKATVSLGRGQVTVVGSAVTSTSGRYALRVSSLSPLAADVTNGIVKFNLMTGNSTGWDMFGFSRGLSGGTTTAVLHLRKPAS